MMNKRHFNNCGKKSGLNYPSLINNETFPINFNNEGLFYIDEEYVLKSKFMNQNEVFFENLLRYYANLVHLIDIVNKENPLNRLTLSVFSTKLLGQLVVFFEERCHENADKENIYFLNYVAPYLCLNKKLLSSSYLLQKLLQILSKIPFSPLHATAAYNLGLMLFAKNCFKEGIHFIETAFKIFTLF